MLCKAACSTAVGASRDIDIQGEPSVSRAFLSYTKTWSTSIDAVGSMLYLCAHIYYAEIVTNGTMPHDSVRPKGNGVAFLGFPTACREKCNLIGCMYIHHFKIHLLISLHGN